MVLCIIAFVVFSVMSIFSAKYRPLAKEGFRCVFRTLTLRPCDTGLDERIKAELVSAVMKVSPGTARLVNKHFTALSWLFVIISVVSLAYSVYSVYNFYVYGNCDGPGSTSFCPLNQITGDYGRFSAPTQLVPPTTYDGIAQGNPNATLKIVEFGDFTCPYTKEAQSTVEELLKEYNGSVYYVFKPFPIPSHNNSFVEARAVLCANRQGQSQALGDEMFALQDVCSVGGSPVDCKGLAQQAGLNMTQFDQCFDNNETGAELETYLQEGKDAHIYATPTFFVNGQPVVGPKTFDQFQCAIQTNKDIITQIKCLIAGMG